MNLTPQTTDTAFDEACAFIIKLGTLVHGYGPNSIRLESYLSRVTNALGYQGGVSIHPHGALFAFSDKNTSWQRTHLADLPGTGLQLARLAKAGELVDNVEAGRIRLQEALFQLDEIDKTTPPGGKIANAAAYAFCGSGFAVLLAGSVWDVFLSALFSLVVYGMVLLSDRLGERANDWLPLSSAFVAGALAALSRTFLPGVNGVLVTLSAILILIPGFSISVGVIELLYRRVVAGSANLMGGLVYLVKQFAGAWMGAWFVGLFVSSPAAVSYSPVNSQWIWLFMPLLIIGLCIVFQTTPKDFFWAFLGCLIAYGGILLGSDLAGANLGNLLGTIIAVVFANGWAWHTRRPTSIVLLPAIVLLVSGSIGFRGMAALVVGQTGTGEAQIFQMFIVALTIAAGLLVGNTLVRPRVTL